MVAPLKFRNGWVISPTLYQACNYLSMLGLKLNHVSKRGHCYYNNRYREPDMDIMVYEMTREIIQLLTKCRYYLHVICTYIDISF